MKKFRFIAIILAIAALCACLTACGSGQGGDEESSVTYQFYAIQYDDAFLENEDMTSNYIRLDADGKGYLYWGDDNQGEISKWEETDSGIMIYAGVSEMPATLENGVLTVDLGDGMATVFASPDADTSGIDKITIEEYAEQLSE